MSKVYLIIAVAATLITGACSGQNDKQIEVPETSGVAEPQKDPAANSQQAIQAPPPRQELVPAPKQDELPPPPPGEKGPDDMEGPELRLAELYKEDGKKWKVNPEVIEAVEDIDEYVDLFLLKDDPAEKEYMEFALGVRELQHKVFESSKVGPPADVHLQEFLMKVDEMIMHVESGEPKMREKAMEVLHKQLHVFPIYFEKE